MRFQEFLFLYGFLDSSEIWICMMLDKQFSLGKYQGAHFSEAMCLSVLGSYQSEGEGQLTATGPASAVPGWIKSCPATLLICGVLNGS